MRAAVAFLLLTGPWLIPAGLEAQQFSISSSGGVVLTLSDGRLAVLQLRNGEIVIDGLVPPEREAGTPLDLRVGDQVVRFQADAEPTLARIEEAWKAVPTGAEVVIGVRREGGGTRMVTFAKPAETGGRRMAVSMGGRSGAGAWVTGEGPSNVTEMVIAGVHLRNNAQGMPEVTHRSSHPAATSVSLRAGDVVTAVNGRGISALAGLELLYGRIGVGEEVLLTVTRAGAEVTVTFAKPAP